MSIIYLLLQYTVQILEDRTCQRLVPKYFIQLGRVSLELTIQSHHCQNLLLKPLLSTS